MSDERLQRARRDWRATGDMAHEVAYLRESLRCGADARPLVLAAYCGHEAAAQALGFERKAAGSLSGRDELTSAEHWVESLQQFGRLALGRGALAVAVQVQPALARSRGCGAALEPMAQIAQRGLEALEAWNAAPSTQGLERLGPLAGAEFPSESVERAYLSGGVSDLRAAYELRYACLALTAAARVPVITELGAAARQLVEATAAAARRMENGADFAARCKRQVEIVNVVRETLRSWALAASTPPSTGSSPIERGDRPAHE